MSAYSNRVIADGAVHYWRLDETSGTVAKDSVGTADGTIRIGVTLGVDGGPSGAKAMRFNGTALGVVNYPAIPESISAAHSIEGWVQIEAPGPPANVAILDRRGFSAGCFFCHAGLVDAVTVRVSPQYPGVFNGSSDPLVAPSAGWHHFVATYDGTTLRMYVDGALSPTAPVFSFTDVSTGELLLSGYNPDLSDQGPASLRDVALYVTVLTPAQVQNHYALGTSHGAYADRVIADGASHYWRLGDSFADRHTVDIVGNAPSIRNLSTLAGQPGVVPPDLAMKFPAGDSGIGIDPLPFNSTRLTMEAWIKRDADGSGAARIGQTGDPGVPACEFAVIAGAANLWAQLGFADATSTGWVQTTVFVPVGVWLHAVLTWDGTWLRIYKNGVEGFAANTWAGKVLRTSSLGAIGAQDGASTFIGTVDEFALYPVALTPAQIAAHYALATAAPSSRPVPWALIQAEDRMNSFNACIPITPSDTVNLPRGSAGGIWVGGAGDVAAMMSPTGPPVVFAAVPAGTWLPIAAMRVNATGTTATALVAFYDI